MSRIVILERLRKIYATFSVPQLLAENRINDEDLIPPKIDPVQFFNIKTIQGRNFTPLWYYDDTEFDSRNADEWITIHNGMQLPVPSMVYLPINPKNEFPEKYKWMDANTIDYHPGSKLYSIVLLNDLNNIYAKVPRIQIHFKGEDPRRFVERIKRAILIRNYCEKSMLWYMYMDKIKLNKMNNLPGILSKEKLQQILTLILKNNKLNKLDVNENSITDEILNNQKRSWYSIILQFKIFKYPDKFKYIELPNFELEDITKKHVRINTEMLSYTDTRVEFTKNNLIVLPEVFLAIWNSNIENLLINEKQLFFTTFSNAVTLEEFENKQLENISQTYWVENIIHKCNIALGNVKTGWFNIYLSNFKIYQSPDNKLRKLITSIEYMMEQQLKKLVVNSAKKYTALIEQPCSSTKNICSDFVWSDNLYKSPFVGNALPILSVILSMNENGPFYSSNPDEFERTLIDVFKKAVVQSHGIPAFHVYLLTNLRFFDNPNLTSIGIQDNKLTEQLAIIKHCIRTAIIPLKAYCREYQVYLPLFNTNVQSFVEAFFNGNPSIVEIKEEISKQIQMKTNLIKALPETIIIGPFIINNIALKKLLVKKRKELANLLMKTHARNTSKQLELCCAEYNRIYLWLNEAPVSIEKLFEMREEIDSLPTLIKKQSEIVKQLISEIEILDAYSWILDNEQLKLKWKARIWPYEIKQIIPKSLDKLLIEKDKFEKIQFENELLLQEKVEYMSSVILQLSIETDLSKVYEIVVDVNKNWKIIKELQSFSQLLNERQILFGHPVTSFETINILAKDFESYKELWVNSAEFFKMQNAWLQNPLINIDTSSLDPFINDVINTMKTCTEIFAEVPGALSVALAIKTQIEEYKPMIKILKNILNPGMKQRHWDTFASETGVKIILSPSLNFKKCLSLGVDKHVEELDRISKNAWEEYNIELALNEMIKEWDGVKLQFLPYKDTGTYIIEIKDDVMQMLDNHIVVSEQLLSTKSFKGIFEKQLIKWEEELILTKAVIEKWIEFQKQWVHLESTFSDLDIKNQLPNEYNKFKSIMRTWKRIMNLAHNKPWVMKICQDKWLQEALINGKIPMNLMEKTLSNYLKTKKL